MSYRLAFTDADGNEYESDETYYYLEDAQEVVSEYEDEEIPIGGSYIVHTEIIEE